MWRHRFKRFWPGDSGAYDLLALVWVFWWDLNLGGAPCAIRCNIRTILVAGYLERLSGMSSESTTPLANRSHLGKRFSALLLIITLNGNIHSVKYHSISYFLSITVYVSIWSLVWWIEWSHMWEVESRNLSAIECHTRLGISGCLEHARAGFGHIEQCPDIHWRVCPVMQSEPWLVKTSADVPVEQV